MICQVSGQLFDSIDSGPGEESRGPGRRGCQLSGKGRILLDMEATEVARATQLLAQTFNIINTYAYDFLTA